jgi:hypothetical protein
MRIFIEIRVPLVVGVGPVAGSYEDGGEGNRGGEGLSLMCRRSRPGGGGDDRRVADLSGVSKEESESHPERTPPRILQVARDPSGAVRPDAPINEMPTKIVTVEGIQERLYRIRVQGYDQRRAMARRCRIFGHPAPEMITDSPAVLNRIRHLKSEAQLP